MSEDKKQQNTAESSSTAIWNPNTAANWCLIFSPAFGAYIQMHNWESLQQHDKAAASKVWFYISLAFLGLALLSGVLWPHSKAIDGTFKLIGMGLLFGWYFTSARAQVTYVKEQLGTGYVKKSWGKPLLIGIVGLVAYLIVATILVVIFAVK